MNRAGPAPARIVRGKVIARTFTHRSLSRGSKLRGYRLRSISRAPRPVRRGALWLNGIRSSVTYRILRSAVAAAGAPDTLRCCRGHLPRRRAQPAPSSSPLQRSIGWRESASAWSFALPSSRRGQETRSVLVPEASPAQVSERSHPPPLPRDDHPTAALGAGRPSVHSRACQPIGLQVSLPPDGDVFPQMGLLQED